MLAPANSAWVCWLCCVVEFTQTGASELITLEGFLLSAVDLSAFLDVVLPWRILDMLLCWLWEATAYIVTVKTLWVFVAA